MPIECQKYHFPTLPMCTTRLTGFVMVYNANINFNKMEKTNMGRNLYKSTVSKRYYINYID